MAAEPTLAASLMGEFSLAGRVAVITGAGSGIGRETAHVLAQAGARVVLADVNVAGLAQTEALVKGAGGTVAVVPTDVTRRAEMDALGTAAISQFGRLDIWVNAAGIILSVPMAEASEDEIDRVIAVNQKAVYAGCAVAGRLMAGQGSGAIVNISSAGGEMVTPGLSIYCMTKAAVNMITRSAAKEFGPHGVRANAVAPGWVDTPLGNHGFRGHNGAIDPDKYEQGVAMRAQMSPIGLTGTPHDIAMTVLYLVSDASRFMTGQVLRPNGGVMMG